MTKHTIWVRHFLCPKCGERHKIEGRREKLDRQQEMRIKHCDDPRKKPALKI